MIGQLWAALQGMAEYGAASGGEATGGPIGPRGGHLTAWASEHQLVLVAAVAGFALIWLVRASQRR
jgi:hypothetical protein